MHTDRRSTIFGLVAGVALLAGCTGGNAAPDGSDAATDEAAATEDAPGPGVAVATDATTELAADASVAGHTDASGLTVAGEGRIEGAPDVLTATIGVEHQAAAVADALDAANDDLAAVRDALVAAGVDEQDLTTQDVRVHPDHRGPEGTAEGYVVTNLLAARIRDLDAAGAALDAGLAAAGDAARLHGVGFQLEDNAGLLEQARQAAVADARDRAEQYAAAAGVELGPLVSVDETGAARPKTLRGNDEMAMEDAQSVPIEPGTQEVGVGVRVTWELAE